MTDWNIDYFDSLFAFCQYLEETPQADGSGNSAVEDAATKHWDLKLGYEGALDYGLGRKFWYDGAEQMAEGYAQAADVLSASSHSYKISEDLQGFTPSVPSYLAGQPESMLQVLEDEKPIDFVSIAIGTFSAGCKAEDMMRRSAAIMTAVDALELAGARCEVIYTHYTSGSKEALEVQLKGFHEPWDPVTCAFGMAHPAMLRRLGLRWMETKSALNRFTQSGYGRSTDMSDCPYTVIFPWIVWSDDYRTMPEALAAVEKQFVDQGVEVSLVGNNEEQAA